ncbi:hypothetical protein BU16DRAFT_310758 [Lophium mytilinum]|uniref:DNA2/NAM7 helicase-like C-terminal domain-containing protein n=1 Tax=Lophium mytilinum TaxID=390894 RepID=A0A6A6QYV7_9PEZI|nr:hypothetical protein BU16DRAFT_310758 [Lophium mytilinum]
MSSSDYAAARSYSRSTAVYRNIHAGHRARYGAPIKAEEYEEEQHVLDLDGEQKAPDTEYDALEEALKQKVGLTWTAAVSFQVQIDAEHRTGFIYPGDLPDVVDAAARTTTDIEAAIAARAAEHEAGDINLPRVNPRRARVAERVATAIAEEVPAAPATHANIPAEEEGLESTSEEAASLPLPVTRPGSPTSEEAASLPLPVTRPGSPTSEETASLPLPVTRPGSPTSEEAPSLPLTVRSAPVTRPGTPVQDDTAATAEEPRSPSPTFHSAPVTRSGSPTGEETPCGAQEPPSPTEVSPFFGRKGKGRATEPPEEAEMPTGNASASGEPQEEDTGSASGSADPSGDEQNGTPLYALYSVGKITRNREVITDDDEFLPPDPVKDAEVTTAEDGGRRGRPRITLEDLQVKRNPLHSAVTVNFKTFRNLEDLTYCALVFKSYFVDNSHKEPRQDYRRFDILFGADDIGRPDDAGSFKTISCETVSDASNIHLLRKLFPHLSREYFTELIDEMTTDNDLYLVRLHWNPDKVWASGLWGTDSLHDVKGHLHESLRVVLRRPTTFNVLVRSRDMTSEMDKMATIMSRQRAVNPYQNFWLDAANRRGHFPGLGNMCARETRPSVIAPQRNSFPSFYEFKTAASVHIVNLYEVEQAATKEWCATAFAIPIPFIDNHQKILLVIKAPGQTNDDNQLLNAKKLPQLGLGDTIEFQMGIDTVMGPNMWKATVVEDSVVSPFDTITLEARRPIDKETKEFIDIPFPIPSETLLDRRIEHARPVVAKNMPEFTITAWKKGSSTMFKKYLNGLRKLEPILEDQTTVPIEYEAAKWRRQFLTGSDFEDIPRTGLKDLVPEEMRERALALALDGAKPSTREAILYLWENGLVARNGQITGGPGTGKTDALIRLAMALQGQTWWHFYAPDRLTGALETRYGSADARILIVSTENATCDDIFEKIRPRLRHAKQQLLPHLTRAPVIARVHSIKLELAIFDFVKDEDSLRESLPDIHGDEYVQEYLAATRAGKSTANSMILHDHIRTNTKKYGMTDRRMTIPKESLGYIAGGLIGIHTLPEGLEFLFNQAVADQFAFLIITHGNLHADPPIQPQGQERIDYKKGKMDLFAATLALVNTAVCTVSTAMDNLLVERSAHFIGVEEAGRAHPREIHALEGFYPASNIIQTGDHLQLAPEDMISNREDGFAAQASLSELHRQLMNGLHTPVIQETSRFYNSQVAEVSRIFNSSLVPDENMLAKVPDKAWRDLARDLTGLPEADAYMINTEDAAAIKNASGSKYNTLHAVIAMNILERAIVVYDIKGSDLLYLSPYRGAVEVLRRLIFHMINLADGFDDGPLVKFANGLKEVASQIMTVDSAMGRERRYAIFDTTVSGTRGFTDDRGRLNVGSTRGRAGLIVIMAVNACQKYRSPDGKAFDEIIQHFRINNRLFTMSHAQRAQLRSYDDILSSMGLWPLKFPGKKGPNFNDWSKHLDARDSLAERKRRKVDDDASDPIQEWAKGDTPAEDETDANDVDSGNNTNDADWGNKTSGNANDADWGNKTSGNANDADWGNNTSANANSGWNSTGVDDQGFNTADVDLAKQQSLESQAEWNEFGPQSNGESSQAGAQGGIKW